MIDCSQVQVKLRCFCISRQKRGIALPVLELEYPAVTLNKTPEEFYTSTGLCQKI